MVFGMVWGMDSFTDHSQKTNRLLQLVLVILFLFLYKMGCLAVAHHQYSRRAFEPRMKTSFIAPLRGDIVDRHGVVLCTNRCDYRAFLCFDEIRDIPRVRYLSGGWKRKRLFPRRDYIQKFSHFLAKELELDAQEIRDLIYAQCAIFPRTSFLLKKGLSEQLYFKLVASERLWPGLKVERCAYRVYPQGRVGSHLVGFLGSFSYEKARRLREERRELKQYIEALEEGVITSLPKGHAGACSVHKRLEAIDEELSTAHRAVGKMGIESYYDDSLKGTFGKKFSIVNVEGRQMGQERMLRDPENGSTLKLSLSVDLQKKAEEVLIEAEGRNVLANSSLTPPWIKGGAIVALCPKTREVLALASTPRFDPNHFIQQDQSEMEAQMELPSVVAKLWEGKSSLQKERLHKGKVEKVSQFYTPKLFWSQITSQGKVRQVLDSIQTLDEAQKLVWGFEGLMHTFECLDPYLVMEALFLEEPASLPLMLTMEEKRDEVVDLQYFIQKKLRSIRKTEDRLLCLDILRLFIPKKELFVPNTLTVEEYYGLTHFKARLEEKMQKVLRPLFIKNIFSAWREKHFAKFLKGKRKEEAERKTYQRPFTVYLEQQKRSLFDQFLRSHLPPLLEGIVRGELNRDASVYSSACLQALGNDLDLKGLKRLAKFPQLLHCMKSFSDLQEEALWGSYRIKGGSTLANLFKQCYPHFGHGYMKSSAFQEIAPMGSLYKIITAYSALKEREQKGLDLNPLTLYDFSPRHSTQKNHEPLGKTLQGTTIRRVHKGGRLPKSYKSIGKVDLPTALEQSSNIYFSLLASDHISDPLFLLNDSRALGLGAKTGVDLPGEVRGSVPYDVLDNKTALYSMAIGQHALTVTPLQAAQALASLATGEVRSPTLTAPSALQTSLFLTDRMKQLIFSGLHRVLNSEKGSANPSSIQYFNRHKGLYSKMLPHIKHTVGKTSTAELYYRPHLDQEAPPLKCNHVWFGAIYFNPQKPLLSDPELVVIVYLKYSDYGKEAAPLAMQIINSYYKKLLNNK